MTSSEWTSAELLARLPAHDRDAEYEVVARYVARLTGLARARLSLKLQRRLSPDDVVMSAFRSFFVGARDERFVWTRAGDLWRILATIAVRKAYRSARRNATESRDLGREDPSGSEIASGDPTPDEAVALADELESALGKMEPGDRRIVSLRLQGCSHAEIALEVDRSERTVRRAIETFRGVLRSLDPR